MYTGMKLIERLLTFGATWGFEKVLDQVNFKGLSQPLIDSILSIAIQNEQLFIVKYLIDKGADIHNRHDTSYRKAVDIMNVEILDYLLQQSPPIYENLNLLLESLMAPLRHIIRMTSFGIYKPNEEEKQFIKKVLDGKYNVMLQYLRDAGATSSFMVYEVPNDRTITTLQNLLYPNKKVNSKRKMSKSNR